MSARMMPAQCTRKSKKRGVRLFLHLVSYSFVFVKLPKSKQAQQNRLTIQYRLQNMGADTRFKRSFRNTPVSPDADTAATLMQKTITVNAKEHTERIRTVLTVLIFFSFFPKYSSQIPGIKKINAVSKKSISPMPSTFSTVPKPTQRIYIHSHAAYKTICFLVCFIFIPPGSFLHFNEKERKLQQKIGKHKKYWTCLQTVVIIDNYDTGGMPHEMPFLW